MIRSVEKGDIVKIKVYEGRERPPYWVRHAMDKYMGKEMIVESVETVNYDNDNFDAHWSFSLVDGNGWYFSEHDIEDTKIDFDIRDLFEL